MDINTTNLEGIRTGFSTIFNQHFQGVEATWNKVAMKVTSTTRDMDYRWMRKLPGMKEWLGQRQVENLAQESYKVVNKSFENTIGVDRDDIEDDQLGVYSPLIADLGQTVAEHPDELIYGLLASAFDTKCFDGQYFIDTDHPVLNADGEETSVSNFQGGSGTPWFLLDMTKAIKPLIYQERRMPQFVAADDPKDTRVFMNKEFMYGVDYRAAAGFGLWNLAYASKQTLNAANYQAAREAMMSFKGDHGRKLRIRPTLLVVPPSLEGEALEVLKKERDAAGATNVYYNTAELHVEQLLG